MLYVEYVSLICLNKFPVVLREFGVDGAGIGCLSVGNGANFAVNSLLIPENGYSGIRFLATKYRPTKWFNKTGVIGARFIAFVICLNKKTLACGENDNDIKKARQAGQ